MKAFFKHLSFALTAVVSAFMVFSSCNKMETVMQSEQAPMSFSPVVGMPTKAIVNGTTFPTSRTMVVSADLGAGTGSTANYFKGVGFTYNSTETVWKPTSGSYYWPLAGSLEIMAYSGGSLVFSSTPTWTNATSVVMTSADYTADDLLVGGLTAATASSKSIAFKHALCKVSCTAKASVANIIKIKSITINVKKGATITATKTAGNSAVSFSTASLTGAADVSMFSGNQALSTTAAAAGNAVMFPAQTPASISVTYTITNNGVESPVMSLTKSLTTAMVSGSAYTLALNMTLTGLTVTATLTDWSNGGSTAVNI